MSSETKKEHGVAGEALHLVRRCRRATKESGDFEDGEHDDWVHLARVGTKRLRSAWHLVRDLIGKEKVDAANERLRAISAAVSEHRDDSVRLEVIKDLRKAKPPRQRTVRARTASKKAAPPVNLDKAWDKLEEAAAAEVASSTSAAEQPDRERLGRLWKAEEAAWLALTHEADEERKPVRRALRRSKRKADALATQAQEDNEAELWHDWRKKVKRLRYQQEIVANLQGRKTGPKHARLSKLGSLLGKRNDLASLRDWLKTETAPLSGKDLAAVLRVIEAQEQPLLAKARRLGRGLR